MSLQCFFYFIRLICFWLCNGHDFIRSFPPNTYLFTLFADVFCDRRQTKRNTHSNILPHSKVSVDDGQSESASENNYMELYGTRWAWLNFLKAISWHRKVYVEQIAIEPSFKWIAVTLLKLIAESLDCLITCYHHYYRQRHRHYHHHHSYYDCYYGYIPPRPGALVSK